MANAHRKIVEPKDLPKRGTHSQVVTVTGGTLVFIAAMTSRSEVDAAPVQAGDMRAQVCQVCENLGRALRFVGGEYSDIVKTTIFTTDVEEFRKANEVRYEYFKSDYPTGSLIGVKRLAHPDLMSKSKRWLWFPQIGSGRWPRPFVPGYFFSKLRVFPLHGVD